MSLKMVAITPQRANWEAIYTKLSKASGKSAKQARAYLEETTKTWSHYVHWTTHEVGISRAIRSKMGFEILTNDEIWNWVDRGTKAHIIRPRHAKALAFPSFSTPKTRPGVLSSTGGSSSPPTIFAQEVHHPGTKARHFTETIIKKLEGPFQKNMEQALNSGAKASGHGI